MTKIDDIIARMESLEKELAEAFEQAGGEVSYTIERKKVHFTREIKRQHKLLVKKWMAYVYESGFLMILTIPVIWGAVIPAVLMDFNRQHLPADLLPDLRHSQRATRRFHDSRPPVALLSELDREAELRLLRLF